MNKRWRHSIVPENPTIKNNKEHKKCRTTSTYAHDMTRVSRHKVITLLPRAAQMNRQESHIYDVGLHALLNPSPKKRSTNSVGI